MNRTLLCLAVILMANGARAQVPHKRACDFLTEADVSAGLGRTVGGPRDPWNDGRTCTYAAQSPGPFNVSIAYSDAPDAEAVAKFLKVVDAKSFRTATPLPGLGGAAFFVHLGSATQGSLTVFVGGTMTLTFGTGTVEQLRALAQKALVGSGGTTFAYNSGSTVPVSAKPATPNASSTSPMDQLKLDLAKKAEADASAALALADLYRMATVETMA